APGLFPAIKRAVDADGRPGRFLLTGSANVLLLPRISESLAGRMEILPLQPLSQGEIEGNRVNLVNELFSETAWKVGPSAQKRIDVCQRLIAGGYPEAVKRLTSDR